MENARKGGERGLLSKILRDPLFHFFVLGGLIFAGVSLSQKAASDGFEIRITKPTIRHIENLFELTWQRKPTPDELNNLIEEHIKEEIYYREALALGLDENDTIVRRRMRQKLEFMQEDLANLETPQEAQLKAYYRKNKDKYKSPQIVSFEQVLISQKKLAQDAPLIAEKRHLLQNNARLDALSVSSLLPTKLNLETKASILNIFGERFFDQIGKLPIGQWQGPVFSPFGTHLVNVSLNQKPKPQELAEVREQVKKDYRQFQREKSAEKYYQDLRSKYKISIEDGRK